MAEGWVISVAATGQEVGGAASGNGQQLYPAWVSAGVNPATAVNGETIRRPLQGAMHSIQIEPDGSNGGMIQIYDMDGSEAGANVSSATAVTNAQIVAALAAGRAKLIYEQQFAGTVGSGPVNAAGIFRGFMKGLVARFSNGNGGAAAGTCTLNLVVDGGYRKNTTTGA